MIMDNSKLYLDEKLCLFCTNSKMEEKLMKDNFKSIQTYKNILMNILAFFVQFIISFYISPVIVSGVGTAAYGYIGLANDFVSYAGIIASVFNSVAARFIANCLYKKEIDKANKYFNSLIVANFVIAIVLSIVSTILIPNLDSFISIPSNILFDVKVSFTLTFVTYIITLITMVFTTSTFISNRTDIQGVRNIIQQLIRFALIVVLLNFISIRLYWVSFAMLIATIVVAIMNIRLTHILTPELTFDLKNAKKEYAFDLAKSGCWMALTSISTILLRGLDLTIANILLGSDEMGVLSIARTFPNNITSIIGTIAPIFTPVFIVMYAQKKKKELDKKIIESISIISLIMYVPITGFIVYSNDFYSLWQGSLSQEEIAVITILSTTTVIQAYFNASTASLAQLSVVANKLKLPVFVSLFCGIISVSLDFFLIKCTRLGIYAIAISPTIVMIIRYVFFNSVYGAYCLDMPKFHYLLNVIKTWIIIPVLLVVIGYIHKVLPCDSWLTFVCSAGVSGIVGYLIMLVIYQRKRVLQVLHRGKGK